MATFKYVSTFVARSEVESLKSAIPTGDVHVEVDTKGHSLVYDFSKVSLPEECILLIHGFAPPGWDAPEIAVLPIKDAKKGIWSYPVDQEKNILAGLAYFTLCGRPPSDGLRKSTLSEAQALPPDGPSRPRFRAQVSKVSDESEAALDAQTKDFQAGGETFSAGGCAMAVELFGVLERTNVEMDFAQVKLVRAPAADFDRDGRLESKLNITVRTGGGYVPGIGKVNVEILEDDSPGIIKAFSKTAVFPASMTFYLRKRYKTPFGTFVGERETYTAKAINQFPPFGTHIEPTSEIVRLLDESTGGHVGNIFLGSIVPLFHLSGKEFPVQVLPDVKAAGGEPRMYKMVVADS